MIAGHVFMALSLDGFVARTDGQLDWLMKQKTGGEDHGYDDFMASVDGLIMGRGSFLNVLTLGDWSYQKPVVVMSRTLVENDIPAAIRGKVRISRATPQALMAEQERQGWKKVYVDGGKIVQSFLRAGLIADMTLTHVPILIGKGLPLFGDLTGDIDLQHQTTQSFPSGLVTSVYRVL